MTEDSELSRRYRELARDEPPRHLDAAILAAAHRELRPRRVRWYVPLAAAAVLVLAVAVTLQLERERPAEEPVAAQERQASEQALAKAEKPQAPPAAAAPPQEVKRELRESARADAPYAEEAQSAAPPAAAASTPLRREKLAAATAGTPFTHASPEQWLQGIADLRRQNRDDEADRQLAEFRKRYPDYRISKEMLERLEMPK